VGDFNIDLKKNSNFAETMASDYALKQIICEPTRITSKTATLIDHIYVNSSQPVYSYGVFNQCISDHSTTFIQLSGYSSGKCRHRLSNNMPTLYRTTKNLDVAALKNDLKGIPWHLLSNCDNVDDMLHTFEQLVLDVWNTHAPLKKHLFKKRSTPWMTQPVLNTIRKRKKAYQDFITDRSDQNWMLYQQIRNKCTYIIRQAKCTFFTESQNHHNSKSFWKVIKACTGFGGKKRT
jgi:hypothetical protein